MDKNIQQLKQRADEAKYLYQQGEMEYDAMREVVQKYIDAGNEIAKRIAKEYNARPRLMNVRSYIR